MITLLGAALAKDLGIAIDITVIAELLQPAGEMGGLLGMAGNIGGGLILGSDRRLKTRIKRVGQYGRVNVYEYRYRGSDTVRRGFMADEVQKVAPEAIVYRPGGIMAVDYAKAMEAAA